MDDDGVDSPGDLRALTGRAGRTAWQALRFGIGVIVGVLLVPGLAVLGFVPAAALMIVGELREGPSKAPVNSYASLGAEMPVKDGGLIIWARSGELTHQTCRGGCDDLLFAYGPGRVVEVRGAEGEVLVRREPPWPLRPFLGEADAKRPQLKRLLGVPS